MYKTTRTYCCHHARTHAHTHTHTSSSKLSLTRQPDMTTLGPDYHALSSTQTGTSASWLQSQQPMAHTINNSYRHLTSGLASCAVATGIEQCHLVQADRQVKQNHAKDINVCYTHLIHNVCCQNQQARPVSAFVSKDREPSEAPPIYPSSTIAPPQLSLWFKLFNN